MEIKYLIEKSQRKAMAQKIAELTNETVKYLGVPSCAYQIGIFTLSKDFVLSFDDKTESEIVKAVLDGLEKAGYTSEKESETLTITMPRSFFTDGSIENLKKVTANKERLLKHALNADSLEIIESDENIKFPWFTIEHDGDAEAYSRFISMLCEFAKNHKRINNKPDTSDNEKYAFRCFLIRLGMIGTEYKSVRKVLLRNLSGSSAFRNGGKNNAVSE
ncbi:MAG: virulence protein [Clostridium sp.]|nr:virulence protein [Clostridium sp.]